MADKTAVANLRALADRRLLNAAKAMAAREGIEFVPPQIPGFEPALKAARLIEAVADLIERHNKAQEKTK